jgi:AcrR family transcriptional regulator
LGQREQNRERLREEIVQAAVSLFAEKGFEAVRVVDIAERVGVTEKTFFNHFPTKLSVLETFAMQIMGVYEAVLRQAVADTDRPVLERLKGVVDNWARAYSSGGRHLGDVITKSGLFFNAEGQLRDRQNETQLLLANLIKQGQKSGEIRRNVDSLQLAELLTALLLSTISNWVRRRGESEGLKQRLSAALDVFLQGARTAQRRK